MASEQQTPGSPDLSGSSFIPTPMVYLKERIVWQYRQVVRDLTLDDALSDEELDEIGAEGWELVSVVVYDGHMYWHFKRPAG